MTFVTINEENYESFLVRLGFTSKEGEINKYSKEYKKSYEIVISLDKTNFKKSKWWSNLA